MTNWRNSTRPPLIRGRYIKHVGCPDCGSSDALAIYSDHAWCFTEDKMKPLPEEERNNIVAQPQQQLLEEPPSRPLKGAAPIDIPDRGLSKQALEKYGVTFQYNQQGEPVAHFYPYFKGSNHEATKIRNLPKTFSCSGPINGCGLFGMQIVPSGGKYITITEGEIDAMSYFQMTGHPAVSVKSATSAAKDCRENWKYLDSFEHIVLCFDKDEPRKQPDGSIFNPGADAALAVAKLFEPGKVLIMDMGEYKDVNDWLKAGKTEEFKKQWWRAKPYSPEHIVNSANVWELLNEERTYESVLYPFTGLNEKTYGLRKSEMVVVTAGTGIGKSTFCKALAVHLKNSIKQDENIGMLMIEESTRETALSLMSIGTGTAFHLPDTEFTPEMLKKAYDEILGDGRFYIQADKMFAYSDIDGIMTTIKYMANALNCKYIILDHISIITSAGENGDERRALDEIVTKLKSLTMQLNICLVIVCHLKRLAGTPAEEGAQITLNDLRGTHGIGQLSNIILALERNGQDVDKNVANTINIRVLKNRFCGRLGLAGSIVFNDRTQQYTEIENEADMIDAEINSGETIGGT